MNVNKEQAIAVLRILTNIKTCVINKDTFIPGVGDCHNQDANYISPFNLTKHFGICWHVFAHTKNELGIGMDFLRPVFVELGYKPTSFPVESTVLPDGDAEIWFDSRSNIDLYFSDDEYSKARFELLEKLIQYFENKLK